LCSNEKIKEDERRLGREHARQEEKIQDTNTTPTNNKGNYQETNGFPS
jgi:hypothetical protein